MKIWANGKKNSNEFPAHNMPQKIGMKYNCENKKNNTNKNKTRNEV